MMKTMLAPNLGKRHILQSNALLSFQNLIEAVTAIKTCTCIKIMMIPTSDNVVVRGKPECAQVQRYGQHIHYLNFHCVHIRVAW